MKKRIQLLNNPIIFDIARERYYQKRKVKRMIKNLISKGINPYSCAIQVGEDYYLAKATYEWWPGVALYHSKDLKNWEIHSYPLNRMSQLDLSGVPNGGGVVSAALSYDGSKFFLVFTNMRSTGEIEQTDNYLVTTDDIADGIWSEPVYLNSLGQNPFLFHKDDKKYLLSIEKHTRMGEYKSSISLKEYSMEERALVGDSVKIYSGDVQFGAVCCKDDYYCLITKNNCEGTSLVLKSNSFWGEYTKNCEACEIPLQKEVLSAFVKAQREKASTRAYLEYNFKTMNRLHHDFQTLRSPLYQALALCSQGMVLRGQDNLFSRFEQSVVARQIESKSCKFETRLEFEPDCEKHMAGIVVFCDTKNWFYQYVTRNDETKNREIGLMVCQNGKICHEKSVYEVIDNNIPVTMNAQLEECSLSFSYSLNSKPIPFGEEFDLNNIYGTQNASLKAGICVQDMLSKEKEAVFEYFNYSNGETL